MSRTAAAVSVGLATTLLAGCGGGAPESTLDVLAASSLTDVFDRFERDFERAHPDVDVRISYGSSTALALQLAEGAPADVLATADRRSMAEAEQADAVGDVTTFASNAMVLVRAPQRSDLTSIGDLGDGDYVRCVDSAPCGAIALQLLERAGVEARPASLEPDVRAVLTKVLAGEVDAGLVYASDAHSAGETLTTVAVPGAQRLTNSYEMAVAADTDDPRLAAQWVALVTGPAGQQALTDAGFAPPDGEG